MELTWFWLTVITILAGSLVSLVTRRKKKKTGRLPPCPKGIPILGHLHMLGENPHQDLQRIAKDHGPIMYMRFGFAPIIVVSSPEAAEFFLKKHDLVFASRPPHEGSKIASWDQRNLTFAAYGPYWRNMRKLCTLELLSTLKINSFRPMRREELAHFVESVQEVSQQLVAVDLSAKVSSLTAEMSCRMVFGKKFADKDIDERGFKTVIQETMKLAATPNLGDYFPFLGLLDLQGLTRKMKAIAKVFDVFFEKVIEDHVRAGDRPEQAKDIVDTMMSIMQSGECEFQFDRRNIKAIMMDLLIGSMDTAAASVEWILSELDQLEYLDMVVKETFRLHPVGPLLIPQQLGAIQMYGVIRRCSFQKGSLAVTLMLRDSISSSSHLGLGGEVAPECNWDSSKFD